MIDGLLRLVALALPREFRARFAEGMLETVRDGLDERRGLARAGFAVRSLVGIVLAGVRERWSPSGLSRSTTPASSPRPLDRSDLMDVVRQELRFAARSLRRRPTFAALVVGTLALGIGATTAVFSVVNGVLMQPLPYAEPDELVMVWAYDVQSEPARGSMSVPDILSLQESTAFVGIEGWTPGSFTLTGGDTPVEIDGARVTGSLLAVLEGTPHLGRDLRAEENSPDAPRVAVLSHGFWVDRLASDPSVVGTTIELDEVAHEIVGVMPPGFEYPDDAEIWVPHRTDLSSCGRGCQTLLAVGRLAPGIGVDAAGERVASTAALLAEEFPNSNQFKGLRVEPMVDVVVGDVRGGLWVLLGAVGGVLLIACANVANLLLVRAASRTTEVAVRSALGASPRRMVGGTLAESALLATMGGALGVGIAALAVRAFRFVPPDTVPRMDTVAVDAPVLVFGAVVTVAVTLLFGLAPAVGLARGSAGKALGGAARAGHRREGRFRAALLAVEVGLSVVLLAGAGLFLRSLVELQGVDLGFDQTEVVRFNVDLPQSKYAELSQISDFYQRLEARLREVPGVEAVGSAWDPPLWSGRIYGSVRVDDRPAAAPGEERDAAIRPATPGFFDVLGLRLLEGRGILPTDVDGPLGVAVVNEAFVRENFPGENPMGRTFRMSASFGWRPAEGFRIVGIVGDVRARPTADADPAIYVPHAQFGPGRLSVHLRGRAGMEGLVTAARGIVNEMDPNLPLTRVQTMREAMTEATGTTRFYLALVGAFAGLAVVMTGVGLFGVVSFLVSRRTREIGVRVALGAGTGRVRSMVVAQGLLPALWGVGIGVATTLLGGRVIESLLFTVRPGDPMILAGVAVLLVALSVLATLVPARRATRVDPVVALRAE